MRQLRELAQLDIDLVVTHHNLRSDAVRTILSESQATGEIFSIPRILVQFWDSEVVPVDVQECLDSWLPLDSRGYERVLFNKESAAAFIADHFDGRHLQAFTHCTHPAMQADYFRLCFIYLNGGVYIDADDEYVGGDLEACLRGSLLKLDPLCYRISSDTMEDPFAHDSADNDLIYYVNNNPLAAPAGHPLVGAALAQATDRLLTIGTSRDVQGLTGPGNLTEVLVRHALQLARNGSEMDFEILRHWRSVAISKWPLNYRKSNRDWRRWTRGGDVT